MKIKITTLLTALLFITCTKENSHQIAAAGTSELTNAQSPDDIPLTDLGGGLYRGYVGGLYPGGSNTPSGTYAQDLLTTSNSIVPIDINGNPDPQKGYVVFISMGGSTGGKNMTALINKTKGNPATYSRLKLINGNQPAQKATLTTIKAPNSLYWVRLSSLLAGHKSSYKQVQIVYLETDDGVTTLKFPDRPNIIKGSIEACLRTMKKNMPNLKVVYLLGRTRTFPNTTTPWNREPSPYYFGWASKWAIQDQINGVPGTEYKGANAVAPMVTWGFYQWADSLPRKTDNFYWRFSQTKDGLHANEVGQDTLSKRFQQFLLTDTYASKWYAAH